MNGKLLKGSLVVLGATGLSVIGLFASDGLRGVNSDLAALTSGSAVCPGGMTEVARSGHTLCVDTYEASPSSECPHKSPRTVIETEANLNTNGCYAASRLERAPWRYVSLPQAQRLCADAGKRLPTSDEWYQLALGTDIDSCVTDSNSPKQTGTTKCISTAGIYDMVGNLWEWTDEHVSGRSFQGRELPEEGYVSEVDSSGVAVSTRSEEDTLFGRDYFWSKDEGVFGMIRGGFYGSETDAGLYTVNASISTSFTSPGIGFRCVKDA